MNPQSEPPSGENKKRGRIALRDIARQAGVSRMTVSLALRNSSQLAPKTREAIRAIALQLGYQPNPRISQLMAEIRKSRSEDHGSQIAYLVAGERLGNWHANYTLQCYWEGAKARCAEAGYSLVEHLLNDPKISSLRLGEILYARGVPGIILAPAHRLLTSHLPEYEMDFSNFSVVEISEAFAPPRLCKALHDHHSSMEALVEHLAGIGYRRIGLALLKHHDIAVHGRWFGGYLVKMRAMNLPITEPLILPEVAPSILKGWVRRERLEVVISATNMFASALESAGLRIPKDIAYADLDLNPLDDSGAFGGIDQNSRRVGMSAVEMLISHIHVGERGIPETPVNVLVEGRVVSGRSMPGIPSAGSSQATASASALRKVKAGLHKSARRK